MKRQPDGRFRGNRAKIELTDKVLISRWVEREVIRLKRMGVVSFETIADLLTQAGRGKLVPTVSLPPDVTFPPGYSISKMGCCKAYRRRLEREPSFEVREHRRLDIDRCEELFFSLQPDIQKRNLKAIEAALRVLALKAKVIGYEAPSKTAESEGVERKKDGPKEVTHTHEEDIETITSFQQAVALLKLYKPTDEES
jgi:hypothetical protein